MLVSHDCLMTGKPPGIPTHLARCGNINSLCGIEKNYLTLSCFSLIPDLIKLSEYINSMKIEKQAQGNSEKYFVFLHRLFNGLPRWH